jgi:hypothetical protein
MTDSGWRKRQIALDKMAENARELGLDYEPSKTIIEMARKAGFSSHHNPDLYDCMVASDKAIELFAELIRADEREACAKLAAATICDTHIPTGVKIYGTVAAKAIRARSQTSCNHEWIDNTKTKPAWRCANCGVEYKKEQA